MRAPTRCPKCEGSMAEGFIMGESYGMKTVTTWQAGEPESSIWTGVKQKKKDQRVVLTWRCSRCGYLENYAPDS